MDYLLDTHTVLWFFNGDKTLLSDAAKDIIQDQQHTKFVSMASVWEAVIKINIGKLVFPQKISGFITQIKKNGFELLPISENHIITLEQLPLIHRDPFDRLLIATAVFQQMGLISCDANIKLYPVTMIW
jgi:PIN domain nuclease of toxin-antitoxin system